MKDLVYKVYQMPETFHSYILEYAIENITESVFDEDPPSSPSKKDPITSLKQYLTSFKEQFFPQIKECKNQRSKQKKLKLQLLIYFNP
jgi:hypothetical protein